MSRKKRENRQTRPWLRLDNAAKIFPPNSSKHDTNVFRFVAELKEDVDAYDLQYALDRTLERFPFYLSVLRRGLFWPYFEQGNFLPRVHQEDRPVCARLYDPNVKSLLFDVSYYQNRINLEVFHALSDGTGGMDFLRTLLCEYLMRRYKGYLPEDARAQVQAFAPSSTEDSFARHYADIIPSPSGKKNKREVAYQEKGRKLLERRLNILDAQLSVSATLARAKSYGVSLTVYLAAALMLAYAKTMEKQDLRQPVVLAIPVNLRNFFPSDSARNFFALISVRHRFSQEEWRIASKENSDPEHQSLFRRLLDSIREQFSTELTEKKLAGRIRTLGALERNPFIRAIPLFIKNFFLRIANDYTQRESTTTLSNLSVFRLPDFCTPYVHYVTAITSTDNSQICTCTYNDILSLSFSSIFEKQRFREHFLRFLSGEGLDVSIGTPPMIQDAKRKKAKLHATSGKANP